MLEECGIVKNQASVEKKAHRSDLHEAIPKSAMHIPQGLPRAGKLITTKAPQRRKRKERKSSA